MTVSTSQWHGRQLSPDAAIDLTRDTYDTCRDAITAARTAVLARAEQAFTTRRGQADAEYQRALTGLRAQADAPYRDAVEVADELTRRLEAARHDAEIVVQDWVSRALPFARRRWEDSMDRMAEAAQAAAQLVTWQP